LVFALPTDRKWGIGLGIFELDLALLLRAFWSSPSDVSEVTVTKKVWNLVFRQ